MCVMCVYVFIFLKRQTLQGINTVSHQHISMNLLTSSTITTLRNNLQFSFLNMTFYKNNKAKRSCWKKVSSTLNLLVENSGYICLRQILKCYQKVIGFTDLVVNFDIILENGFAFTNETSEVHRTY